jgi:hypothetical protein
MPSEIYQPGQEECCDGRGGKVEGGLTKGPHHHHHHIKSVLMGEGEEGALLREHHHHHHITSLKISCIFCSWAEGAARHRHQLALLFSRSQEPGQKEC